LASQSARSARFIKVSSVSPPQQRGHAEARRQPSRAAKGRGLELSAQHLGERRRRIDVRVRQKHRELLPTGAVQPVAPLGRLQGVGRNALQ